MDKAESRVTAALLAELKRRMFEECEPRVLSCLNRLSEEQIWWRPNEQSNSIGNIVLHLCGNVRQWIGSGVAEKMDVRDRQSEFDHREIIPAADLISRFRTTMREAEEVIDTLPPDKLLDVRPVQVYRESVLSILIHVTEHLAYHTGQIAWVTKMLIDDQLGFYAGQDLG